LTATLYCEPTSTLYYGYTRKKVSGDDIVVIKTMEMGFEHQRVRRILRGEWVTLEKSLLDMCQYGRGEYTLTVM
jgi:hypothetical protein